LKKLTVRYLKSVSLSVRLSKFMEQLGSQMTDVCEIFIGDFYQNISRKLLLNIVRK